MSTDKEELNALFRNFGFKELAVSLLLILLVVFGYSIYQQDNAISKTSLELYSNKLSQAISEVHLSWLKDGKPEWVHWRETNFHINDFGWPVSVAQVKVIDCPALWTNLLGVEFDINNEPLQIKVLLDTEGVSSGCFYYVQDVIGIEYWARNGRIVLKAVDEGLQ